MRCINYQEKWQYTSDRGTSSGGSQYDYSYNVDEVENACTVITNGIKEIENQLKKIDDVANAINESANDWKGADANEYIQNMKAYEKDIIELKNTYQSSMNVLRNTSTVEIERETAIKTEAQTQLRVN